MNDKWEDGFDGDNLGDPGIEDNDFDVSDDLTIDEPVIDDSIDSEPTEFLGSEATEMMGEGDYESSGNNEAWSESMSWGMPESIDSTPTQKMHPIDDFIPDDEPDLLEQNEELSATVQNLRSDKKDLERQVGELQDDNFTLSNSLEDNINSQRLNKVLYGVIAALVILTIGVSWWGATNSGEASRIAGENAIGQRENMTKDEQISSLESQIASEQEKLKGLQDTIRDKDREINNLSGQVSSRSGEINAANQAKDAAIEERNAAQGRISDLERRLREAESKPQTTATTTATTTVTEREVTTIQAPPETVTETIPVETPAE